jgi:hypothetical protein
LTKGPRFWLESAGKVLCVMDAAKHKAEEVLTQQHGVKVRLEDPELRFNQLGNEYHVAGDCMGRANGHHAVVKLMCVLVVQNDHWRIIRQSVQDNDLKRLIKAAESRRVPPQRPAGSTLAYS